MATGDSCRGNSLPGVQSEPNSIPPFLPFPSISFTKNDWLWFTCRLVATCRSNGAINPPLENPSCKFRSIVLVQLLTANHSQLWFADLFCCAYDWGVSGKTPPEPDEAASSGRSMTLACVPANINQYWISTLTSLRNAYLHKSPPPDRDNPIFQGTFESSVIILVFFYFGVGT